MQLRGRRRHTTVRSGSPPGAGYLHTSRPTKFSRTKSTMSTKTRKDVPLSLQKQPGRVLDTLLHPDQESHGFLAIDNPMVIAQGQIHHRADLDLTTNRHRTVLDLVHPKNTALWWIQNRSA